MFKVIDTYEEACEYSQAGLLWCKWSERGEFEPDPVGYFPNNAGKDDFTYETEERGFVYAILVEED